jgi:hypothetical protein
MVRTVLACAFLLGPPAVQDSSKHDSSDPTACRTCRPVYDRAVAYVRANYPGSNIAGHVYAGLLFLIQGQKGSDLQACVQFASRAAQSRTGGNSNWYIALAAYFLSEVQLRDPSPAVQGALVSAINAAASTMEQTGGWGHSPGFWRSNNYHKKGGSRDLGMVTSLIFAALLNMKAAGIAIPDALFRRVEKHLESISDGHGFSYGTDNKVPDTAMGRGGYVLLGLTNAQISEHPFYAKIAEGLSRRVKDTGTGHACACLHFFSAGAAMHRLGKYPEFASHWIDRLIAAQKRDGSISLECDRGDKHADPTSDAAVLAILLLLQQEGAFKAEGRKVEWKPAPAPRDPKNKK